MRNRARARRKALRCGYFWIPCPSCGQMFGGQEWKDRRGRDSCIPSLGGYGSGVGICPDCTDSGVGWLNEALANWPTTLDDPRGLVVP